MFSGSKKFLFLLMAALVAVPALVQAKGGASGEARSLQLWGKTVQYQYILKNNSGPKVDGEAFIAERDGKKIPTVILNKAYFKKEAGDLFHRLTASPLNFTADSLPELHALEKNLMSWTEGQSVPALTSLTKGSLKDLQKILEQMAWKEAYTTALQGGKDRKEAERIFVEEFTNARLQTIEYHEVSHLIDLQNIGESQVEGLEQVSELNAFYTELAYGNNPQDVMAQALAGLIDEMNRGQVVDQSITKVVTVLEFLKKCPRFAKLFKKGPMPKCCLEILAQIQKSDFIFAGRELYQKNQRKLTLAYAIAH